MDTDSLRATDERDASENSEVIPVYLRLNQFILYLIHPCSSVAGIPRSGKRKAPVFGALRFML
jgi:hypothetical protein